MRCSEYLGVDDGEENDGECVDDVDDDHDDAVVDHVLLGDVCAGSQQY